jgi:hypothetical protein
MYMCVCGCMYIASRYRCTCLEHTHGVRPDFANPHALVYVTTPKKKNAYVIVNIHVRTWLLLCASKKIEKQMHNAPVTGHGGIILFWWLEVLNICRRYEANLQARVCKASTINNLGIVLAWSSMEIPACLKLYFFLLTVCELHQSLILVLGKRWMYCASLSVQGWFSLAKIEYYKYFKFVQKV